MSKWVRYSAGLVLFTVLSLLTQIAAAEPAVTRSPMGPAEISTGMTKAGMLALVRSVDGQVDRNALGALGLASLVIGPSMGRWAAGEIAVSGVVVRSVGVAAIAIGLERGPAGDALTLAGLTILVGSTLYDTIAGAAASHRRSGVTVSPTLINRAPGVMVGSPF